MYQVMLNASPAGAASAAVSVAAPKQSARELDARVAYAELDLRPSTSALPKAAEPSHYAEVSELFGGYANVPSGSTSQPAAESFQAVQLGYPGGDGAAVAPPDRQTQTHTYANLQREEATYVNLQLKEATYVNLRPAPRS